MIRKVSFFLAVLMLFAALCGCAPKEETWTEIQEVPSSSMYVNFPFKQAVAQAEVIVFGTVEGRQESIVTELQVDKDFVAKSYRRKTVMNVIECLKGEAKRSYVFKDKGGIEDGVLYIYRDFLPTEVGSTVLLFLFKDGHIMGPNSRMVLNENNTFDVYFQMLPQNDDFSAYSGYSEYVRTDAETYLEMIRQEVAAQEQTPLQTAP